MGVALKNGAIHERARISLVRIADDIFLIAGGRCAETPFHSCRETAASTPSKPGLFHLVNHRCRGHLDKTLSQSLVSVSGDVLVNIVRVDIPAVAQYDSMLFTVERNILVVTDLLSGQRFFVKKTCDDAALIQMLFDDFCNV